MAYNLPQLGMNFTPPQGGFNPNPNLGNQQFNPNINVRPVMGANPNPNVNVNPNFNPNFNPNPNLNMPRPGMLPNGQPVGYNDPRPMAPGTVPGTFDPTRPPMTTMPVSGLFGR